MPIPIIGPILNLGSAIVGGITGYVEKKQELKSAIVQNKIRLAQSTQSHDQTWELRSLQNSGWKDEVLFLGIIAVYIYSAIDPIGSAAVFKNWELLPEWFTKISFILFSSVLGVKKLGDYLPPLIKGVKEAVKR